MEKELAPNLKAAMNILKLRYNEKETANQNYSRANLKVLAIKANKTFLICKEEATIKADCV